MQRIMKIAFFRREINPEIGALVAGYSMTDHSVMIEDDIFMTGLLCDDGENKVLLISFDLQALDEWFIKQYRSSCGEILGIPASSVMFTCTHNHSGPQTICEPRYEHLLHRSYMDDLGKKILEETEKLTEKLQDADCFFYSSNVDENLNRRYVTPDNHASFLPSYNEMRPLCDGFADKELGCLFFIDPVKRLPLYIIGNYAAHPLAGHAPGLGGLKISADFPGAFRNYITAQTGAECMFVSGAAGDMIPKEDELGSDAARQMGIRLAKAALRSHIAATRNKDRYCMQNAKVGGLSKKFTVPLRKKYLDDQSNLPDFYQGSPDITLEIQCISIGDVCFVGLPGEPCAELGQEIKWHSPFRRTFIAFASTAYIDYVVPGNFLVSGGYEPRSHHFSARNSINFVKAAVDATYDLRESVYPSEGEPYPDYIDHPLVWKPGQQ